MQALLTLANSSLHTEHEDWLVAALREQRDNVKCWKVISRYLKDWLRVYSLDPDLKVSNSHGGSGDEKLVAEREKRKGELDERLVGLSTDERDFLTAVMRRDDTQSNSSFGKMAFSLLTGMPLAEFSETLVAWAFSQAINSDFYSPYDEFQFLVQFNNFDWAETRKLLLEKSSLLH